MTLTRKLAASALGATATLILASCGDNGGNGNNGNGGNGTTDAEPITLQYAFFAPETTFPGVQMNEWVSEIEERTDAQVTVETFPGGTLLDSGEIYDGVASGIVDIGLDLPTYDTSQFPFTSVTGLPLGFENAEQGSAAWLDLLLEYEPEEMDGFFVITAFTAEPVYIATTEPVTSRDDIAGMTLRSPGSVHVPTIEALGGNPIGMPTTEIAENLGTGVIDGFLGTREQLQDFGFAEHLDYLTDYPLGISGAFVAVMNQEDFDALPEDVQNEILGLREDMSAFAGQYQDSHSEESVEWAIEEHGLELVELDEGEAEEWETLMDQIIEDWIAEQSDAYFDPEEVIERFSELRDEHFG